jgi:sensor domain CHASE-containing protein
VSICVGRQRALTGRRTAFHNRQPSADRAAVRLAGDQSRGGANLLRRVDNTLAAIWRIQGTPTMAGQS